MDPIKQLANAIREVRGLIPQIVTGTVQANTVPGNSVSVALDNDPKSDNYVSAINLIDYAFQGQRVLCLKYPPRGLVVLGSMDASLNARTPMSKFKTSNQIVNNSTTVVNDLHIVMELPLGRWQFDFHGFATGPSAGGIKLGWNRTGTSTVVGSRSCLGASNSSAGTVENATMRTSGNHGMATAIPYRVDSSPTPAGHIWETFVLDITVSGVLTLQWAQNSATGSDTTLLAGSYLTATPLQV